MALHRSLRQVLMDHFGSKGISLLEEASDFFIDFLIALVILLVGFRLVRLIVRIVRGVFKKTRIDDTLQTFLLSFISVGLKILVIFIAVSRLGVGTSSVIALLGSAGLAVGLSLQGSLGNIAGGVVLLFLKPFTVGDYIIEETNGKEGVVESVGIIYTKLLTIENKAVMIPNGILANSSITNLTRQDERTVQIKIGVAYSSDIDQVRKVLYAIAGEEPLVLNEPVKVFVDDYLDSSIRIGLRYTIPTDLYWESRWRVQEKIHKEFRNHGIEIPFNQLDVNLVK